MHMRLIWLLLHPRSSLASSLTHVYRFPLPFGPPSSSLCTTQRVCVQKWFILHTLQCKARYCHYTGTSIKQQRTNTYALRPPTTLVLSLPRKSSTLFFTAFFRHSLSHKLNSIAAAAAAAFIQLIQFSMVCLLSVLFFFFNVLLVVCAFYSPKCPCSYLFTLFTRCSVRIYLRSIEGEMKCLYVL